MKIKVAMEMGRPILKREMARRIPRLNLKCDVAHSDVRIPLDDGCVFYETGSKL